MKFNFFEFSTENPDKVNFKTIKKFEYFHIDKNVLYVNKDYNDSYINEGIIIRISNKGKYAEIEYKEENYQTNKKDTKKQWIKTTQLIEFIDKVDCKEDCKLCKERFKCKLATERNEKR